MEIGHRALKKRSQEIITEHQDLLAQDPKVLEELNQECPGAKSLAHYVSRSGAHPVSKNTSVEYYPLGEIMFEAMKVELRKAESFIFLEYFIIDEGKMWGQILDILVVIEKYPPYSQQEYLHVQNYVVQAIAYTHHRLRLFSLYLE